jgi:hypothetical protein
LKEYLFLLTAGFILTGCDQVKTTMTDTMNTSNYKPPTIVISPRLEINDHGQLGLVSGFNDCPGSVPNASGCIIIEPNDKTIPVIIVSRDAAIKSEHWTVERSEKHPNESALLKRPDNSYVTLWGNKL